MSEMRMPWDDVWEPDPVYERIAGRNNLPPEVRPEPMIGWAVERTLAACLIAAKRAGALKENRGIRLVWVDHIPARKGFVTLGLHIETKGGVPIILLPRRDLHGPMIFSTALHELCHALGDKNSEADCDRFALTFGAAAMSIMNDEFEMCLLRDAESLPFHLRRFHNNPPLKVNGPLAVPPPHVVLGRPPRFMTWEGRS